MEEEGRKSKEQIKTIIRAEHPMQRVDKDIIRKY